MLSQSKPITAIVVGAGHRALLYASYAQKHPDELKIVGVADLAELRRRQVADLYDLGPSQVFESAEEVAARPRMADVIINGTMDHQHVPTSIPLLEVGYDMLLEKPFATNEAEMWDLVRVAKRHGRKVVICHVLRYAPFYVRIRQRVRSGEIGDIWSVQVHHGQNILKYRPDYFETYYGDLSRGGGCLQDDALHVLMGLEMLLGPEQEVACQLHNIGIRGPKVTADDTAWLWIRYPNDVVVTVDFSVQCHWKHNEWIVSASRGAIRFLVEEPSIFVFDAASDRVREEHFGDNWNETFRANDKSFVDAIRGKAASRCTLAMARTTLRAVLAAQESAKTGRPVRL